jgi:lycopene beta-cyclase
VVATHYDADLIIAGGGCAGLSVLWYALQSTARTRRIIVIDQALGGGDDRTWAFWGDQSSPFVDLADNQWHRLRVRFANWEHSADLVAGTYARVRRLRYNAAILNAASGLANVQFVNEPILEIRDEHNCGVVRVPTGELRAALVMQSVQISPRDADRPIRHPLRQHFGGWEVRTEHAVFDPSIATLMDFDTDQHDAVAFFYVLPTAPDRALVEHTMFSLTTQPATFHFDQVTRFLDRLNAGAIAVEQTEHGVIPMEDRIMHQRWGPHVWNIGTAGGRTKPSTGYTFQRVHAQSQHLINQWASGATLTPLPSASKRYALADRTLLSILHHRPELGRPIFERLFRTTSIEHVLQFLDEDSTLRRDATMVAQLPWKPFIRAATREIASAPLGLLKRGAHP